MTRQAFKEKHYEQTGSIYIFKKTILDKYNNRIGGKIELLKIKSGKPLVRQYISKKYGNFI